MGPSIDEIRERYLDFFKKRGHTVYPSDSLVPSNDPSLLFTGAGMNQFKDMFLGRGALPFKRAATAQKCLRTGDLESVGRTARHHTFFEMLGNFSFGDYFKREAIGWAWQFVNQEMNIPADRLTISVYQEDDEAYDIWNDEIGLPPAKIRRLGEADNFWPASAPSQGPNGPCGPCSEIYYDFGARHGCGSPDCDITCGCNRYVEIWNLVFTQFDRQEGGVLAPLPQKNIDTGAGLERFGAVLQGVHSNFETDVFKAVIGAGCMVLNLTYTPGTEQSSRLRRIADHVRALTFCIADNALPSNEGRGYVVRRILRTALRDGVQLGHKQAFLHRLVPAVVEAMKKGYPYLTERRPVVEKVIKTEEEGFLRTLEKGNELIAEAVARLRKEGKDVLPGEEAFKLYDTFGFPIEMTEQILRDHKLRADRVRFEQLLEEARKRSGGATTDQIFVGGALGKLKEEKRPPAEFLGYGVPVAQIARPHDATVVRVVRIGSRKDFDASKRDLTAFTKMLGAEGSTLVESAGEGTDVAVLLDRTPFYAESGGQVGDAGTISADGLEVAVEDCKKPDGIHLHLGRVAKGTIRAGQKVKAAIDAARRLDIMRNHTGTHLLHAALRSVLGSHVQQAGSVVEPGRLRFDFHHFQALAPEEIRKVEDWVNRAVFEDHAVSKVEMTKDEAEKKGAIAFFGEKYGDRVRVVSVGSGLSVELCGGTHLEHAGTIGAFRITSESSIGSGTRRIEAVTGPKVVEAGRAAEAALGEAARLLKSPPADVPRKIQKLLEEVAKLKSSAGVARKGADGGFAASFEAKRAADGKAVLVRLAEEAGIEELRNASDREMDRPDGPEVAAFASVSGAYLLRVRAPGKDAPDARAYNEQLKKLLQARGGGRPEMVQGSFPKAASLEELRSKLEGMAW